MLQIDSLPPPKKSASGSIALRDTVPWPATLLMPDIMGWFAWIPMMECRHGVVNLDAVPSGTLQIGIGCTGGSPDMMSASEGGVGSWKSGRSKGGCVNSVV